MSDHQHVAIHYDNGGLLAAIEAGAAALGKTPDSISVDDLGPVDEFHIGGRQASEDLLSQLALSAQQEVLDIGCGLGGSARFVASRYGSRVTGIDLTAEFVATGNMLCRWVGLADRRSRQRARPTLCRGQLRHRLYVACRDEHRRQGRADGRRVSCPAARRCLRDL